MKRSLLLVLFFLACVLSSCKKTSSLPTDYIVAEVNGESIYYSEIENALKNIEDGNITFDAILRNSINELLVVQMAPSYGIDVPQEEFETYIEQYKTSYADIYAKGVELYGGEDKFMEGLLRQKIFNKTRSYLTKNVLEPITVSDEEISAYCEMYSVDPELLSEDEYDVVYDRLHLDKEDVYFFEWMLSQWEKHDIKIYYGSYANTSSLSKTG